MRIFIMLLLLTSNLWAQVSRPARDVTIKSDFCICQDGKSLSPANTCLNFCAGKNTNGAEILFANFNVSPRVQMSHLQNLYGWCNYPMPGDVRNPMCLLDLANRFHQIYRLQVWIAPGTNSLQANVGWIPYNQTLRMVLTETSSGARSTMIDFVKVPRH